MSRSVQINIPKPCHENWHSMTPKEQGRFCGSCDKIVVDFSKMSDRNCCTIYPKQPANRYGLSKIVLTKTSKVTFTFYTGSSGIK
jgi:hypothetical protein